jgi:hypothetical protein
VEITVKRPMYKKVTYTTPDYPPLFETGGFPNPSLDDFRRIHSLARKNLPETRSKVRSSPRGWTRPLISIINGRITIKAQVNWIGGKNVQREFWFIRNLTLD